MSLKAAVPAPLCFMMRTHLFAAVAVALVALVPADADAFQIYAPWTNLGDAETWYDVGPDWTRGPNYAASLSATVPLPSVLPPGLSVAAPAAPAGKSAGLIPAIVPPSGLVAPSAIPTASGAFYALTTVRERSDKAGTQRFVSIESRSTQDPNAQGCASGFGDLGLPTFPGTRHPSLAAGQPFWVSTPAVTDGWVFVTVVEHPRPYSDFMMAGRLFAKRQVPGAADICSGWEPNWQELTLMRSTWNEDEQGHRLNPPRMAPAAAGSAPTALSLPPGAPGAGNTYVCVDPMHDFSQPVSAHCFVRRRGQNTWTSFGVEVEVSLGYPIGRPSLMYDRCRRRVIFSATDSQTRVAVNFAVTEPRADGTLVRRDGGFVLLPTGRSSAGAPTLFQTRDSCDINLVVRVAAHTQFWSTAIAESERQGCHATGPGPSVGCVNGAQYITAKLPGDRPAFTAGWTFSPTPLPLRTADHGVAVAFAPRTEDSAVVILDRNDKGRNYTQFAVGPKGWGAPSTYYLR